MTGSLGKKTSLKSKQHWPSFIMILLPNHSEEFTYAYEFTYKDNNPHIQFSDHIINLDFQRSVARFDTIISTYLARDR